jgi:hypothetical protein
MENRWKLAVTFEQLIIHLIGVKNNQKKVGQLVHGLGFERGTTQKPSECVISVFCANKYTGAWEIKESRSTY